MNVFLAAGFSSQGLVDWLQGLLGPLFLGAVSIMAVFFLFTRETTKFAQFVLLAIVIAVVFYTPGIIQVIASALTAALGVH